MGLVRHSDEAAPEDGPADRIAASCLDSGYIESSMVPPAHAKYPA